MTAIRFTILTMKTCKFWSSGFFIPRLLLAITLCFSGVALAMFSLTPPSLLTDRVAAVGKASPRLQRDMPIPGKERGDADQLNRMEAEWNNRLTYPTGIFDPAWLQAAALQDSLIQRAIPA